MLTCIRVAAYQVSSQMASMVKKGINSFKFFMAYKGALMVGDELLLDGLQRCKELGALAMVKIPLSVVPAALLLSGVIHSISHFQVPCSNVEQ